MRQGVREREREKYMTFVQYCGEIVDIMEFDNNCRAYRGNI